MKTMDTKLIKTIFFLSLPAIIEMALNTMLGVADTIMISRLINPSAVAASGYSNQLIFLLIFVFSSFNTGAIAMTSRAYGQKNFDRVNQIANQNLVLNFLIGMLIFGLSALFYRQLFSIYEITGEVRAYAFDYFTIITWGLPFLFISFSVAATMRGMGDTRTPMVVVGISNITNIILNYLLITGAGPFPTMGIRGAALATTLSRMLAAGIYIFLISTRREHLRPRVKRLRLNREIFSTLWKLSLPGAVEQFFMHSGFLVAGVIISQLSTLEEASFRIMLSIESISFMPAVGISIATATLVGKALGEEDLPRSLHTGYIATGMSIIWGVAIGIVFILIPETLLRAFTEDATLIQITVATMIAAGVNQPFLNPMIVLTGALRGAGDTRTVMMIVILRLWTVFIPLTYLFIMVLNQSVKGLWFAETLSFLVFLPITFIRFHNKEWQNIKV